MLIGISPFSNNLTKVLSDSELKVFETEFQRTGFQGGLNWYRATKSAEEVRDLSLFHGRRIVVPSLFIAGESEW